MYYRQPHGFNMRLLKRGFYILLLRIAVNLMVLKRRVFHTLIRNILFRSPIHPPSEPNVLVSGFNTICNRPSPPLTDIVHFDPLHTAVTHNFKTCVLKRGFHTLINNVMFTSPIDTRSHNPLPWRPAFLLTHHSVSGSDTICNSQSLSLVDIIRFGLLHITVSFMILKRI